MSAMDNRLRDIKSSLLSNRRFLFEDAKAISSTTLAGTGECGHTSVRSFNEPLGWKWQFSGALLCFSNSAGRMSKTSE